MTAANIGTPNQLPAETTAQPAQLKGKKQFSLATLLLVVLWLASGYSIWFYWKPWVLVDEFPIGNAGLRYAQDGSRLLRFVDDVPVEVEAWTGKIVKQYPFKLKQEGLICISSDWERLACSVMQIEETPAHIDIYNMRTGELEKTIVTDQHALRFSQDGKQLFVGSYHWSVYAYQLDKNELLWRMSCLSSAKAAEDDGTPRPQQTREEEKKLEACARALFKAQTIAELDDAVDALEQIPCEHTSMELHFSPYADVAVTHMTARNGSQAFVWDVAAGKRGAELKDFFKGEDMCFVFTQNGNRLAVLDPSAAKAGLWDLATGDRLSAWENHDSWFLALTADGSQALSVSSSLGDHQQVTRLWDVSTGRLLEELPLYTGASFSPDGRRIVGLGAQKLLEIHDTATGDQLCALPAPLGRCRQDVTYAPDGRGMIATAADVFDSVAKIYRRNHTEAPYGWLAMPVAWVFIASSLVLLWRIARNLTANAARRSRHASLSASPPA